MKALLALPAHELNALADALNSGRLALPPTAFSVQRVLGRPPDPDLLGALERLGEGGLAGALRLAAAAGSPAAPDPELVWTGPDETRALRSTAAVVEELFRAARHRVLLSGFAITAGAAIFGLLASRMDADPSLEVRLFLNVHHRERGDAAETVAGFARDFRDRIWPGKRLPIAYYDPRSLAGDRTERAVLHAKCVVVDGTWALVTSANFTPHAQQRNVELGVSLQDPNLASRIEEQFTGLARAGHLLRLPGI